MRFIEGGRGLPDGQKLKIKKLWLASGFFLGVCLPKAAGKKLMTAKQTNRRHERSQMKRTKRGEGYEAAAKRTKEG